MKVDLHLHTTYSDGKLTPQQIVKEARKLNLRAIAITDHDTVDGVPSALDEAKKYSDLEVIPGIELSTDWDNQEIHILGYYVDYNDSNLKAVLSKLQQRRRNRIVKIVEKLKDMNIDISFNEVSLKSSGSSLGRPHIASVLVEKGYVTSVKDAFYKYLGRGKPAYVPREKLTPFNAIDIIKQSKGVPVLAHPGLLDEPQIIIEELINYGLMGIEVYHKDHSLAQTNSFIELAKRNDILLTGGSDCHGEKPLLLGTLDIPEEYAKELKKGGTT